MSGFPPHPGQPLTSLTALLLLILLTTQTACQRQQHWPFQTSGIDGHATINESEPVEFQLQLAANRHYLLEITPFAAELQVDIQHQERTIQSGSLVYFRTAPLYLNIEPTTEPRQVTVRVAGKHAAKEATITWQLMHSKPELLSTEQLAALDFAQNWLRNNSENYPKTAQEYQHTYQLLQQVRSKYSLLDDWLLFYLATARYAYAYDWDNAARITASLVSRTTAEDQQLLTYTVKTLLAMSLLERSTNDSSFAITTKRNQTKALLKQLISRAQANNWTYEAGQLLNNLGVLHYYQKNYSLAQQHYQSAHQIAESAGDRYLQYVVHHNLQNVLAGQGKYEAAEKLFKSHMAAINTEKYRENHANAMYELGRIQIYLGKFQEAEINIEQSKHINTDAGNLDMRPRADLQLARLYHELGDRLKAKYYIEQALTGINTHNNGEALTTAQILYAEILNSMHDTSASSIIDSAIKMATNQNSKLKARFVKVKIAAAQADYSLAAGLLNSIVDEADPTSTMAYEARIFRYYIATKQNKPKKINQVTPRELHRLLAHIEKSAITPKLFQYYFYASEVLSYQNHHQASQAVIRRAINLYYQLQRYTIWRDMRPEFAKQNEALIDKYIRQLGEEDPIKALRHHLALNALIDLEQHKPPTPNSEHSMAIRALQANIGHQINHKPNTTVQPVINSSQTVIPPDPSQQYFDTLDNAAKNINLANIPGYVTVLVYQIGKHRSYLWAVSQDSVNFFRLTDEEVINDAVMSYHKEYTAINSKNLALAAEKLSQVILDTGSYEFNEELWIVYDGLLKATPFDLLSHPQNKHQNLISQHRIVMVTDLVRTLERYSANNNTTDFRKALLAGNPVDIGNAESIPYNLLPGSEKELKDIGNHFTALPHDFISDTEFTRGFFIERSLAPYTLIHFSTHAFIETQNPELSYLVTSRLTPDITPIHSNLTALDIRRLSLSGAFITLSVCETSIPDRDNSYNSRSLIDDFFSAGSRYVIGTVKKVIDDDPSYNLQSIYKEFRKTGTSNPAASFHKYKSGANSLETQIKRSTYQLYM